MLDYSKFVTKKGSKIETHFENEVTKAEFEKFPKESEESLIRMVDMFGVDTGKQTIHLVINNQMAMRIMNEEDFLLWQSQPENDWFHLNGFEFDLPDLLLATSLGDLFGGMISGLIFNDPKDGNSFTGATVEECNLLSSKPELIECLITIALDKNCICCPSPDCRRRSVSFSKEEFEKFTDSLNKK